MGIAAQVVDENPELAKEVMKLLAFAGKTLHAIYINLPSGVQASLMALSLSTACRRPSLP